MNRQLFESLLMESLCMEISDKVAVAAFVKRKKDASAALSPFVKDKAKRAMQSGIYGKKLGKYPEFTKGDPKSLNNLKAGMESAAVKSNLLETLRNNNVWSNQGNLMEAIKTAKMRNVAYGSRVIYDENLPRVDSLEGRLRRPYFPGNHAASDSYHNYTDDVIGGSSEIAARKREIGTLFKYRHRRQPNARVLADRNREIRGMIQAVRQVRPGVEPAQRVQNEIFRDQQNTARIAARIPVKRYHAA